MEKSQHPSVVLHFALPLVYVKATLGDKTQSCQAMLVPHHHQGAWLLGHATDTLLRGGRTQAKMRGPNPCLSR